MAEAKNVPRIRFPGFSEEWEMKKFGDFAMRESSTLMSSAELPSVEYEDVIVEEGRLNKDISQKEATKSGIAFDGSQILYGKLRPYLHNWLNPDFEGVAVGDWWVLRPIDIDKNFLYRLIQTTKFDDVANQSTGSKMPRADWKLVSNSEFGVPNSAEEQTKIADFFADLDALIASHRQELEDVRKLKSAMLQKMFPREGEDYPEVRFPGFTDAWETRKLGDVADFSKGSGYSKSDLIESGAPIILYGRLYTKYETIISDVDTYVEAREGAVYSEGGEIIIPASGETAEDIARASVVGKAGIILGGDLNVVMPNSEINSAFLAISISNGNSQRELARKAQGKSVVHIHNEEIRNLMIPFPTMEEQNEIVDYFSDFDSLITLREQEIEHLGELKKGLLQQMFCGI